MKNIQSKFCPVPLEKQNANKQMKYDLYFTVGFIFPNLIARRQPKLAGSSRFLYWHLNVPRGACIPSISFLDYKVSIDNQTTTFKQIN